MATNTKVSSMKKSINKKAKAVVMTPSRIKAKQLKQRRAAKLQVI